MSLTLRTGPLQATQASETIRASGSRRALDGGNERYIETSFGQPVGQSTGYVGDDLGLGQEVGQALDEGLGVQIPDSADS